MVQLTKEQHKILKRISKGKYIYPDSTYDIRSEAFQNTKILTDEKLIEYELNSDGGSYYTDFSLTIEGKLALESHNRQGVERLRHWIVAAIALAALINSILLRFGI